MKHVIVFLNVAGGGERAAEVRVAACITVGFSWLTLLSVSLVSILEHLQEEHMQEDSVLDSTTYCEHDSHGDYEHAKHAERPRNSLPKASLRQYLTVGMTGLVKMLRGASGFPRLSSGDSRKV